MAGFINKSVSIKLKREMGVFQGLIKQLSPDQITLTGCFHNGVKLNDKTSEVTIGKDEIEVLEFVEIADPLKIREADQRSAQSNKVKPFKPVQNYNHNIGYDHKTTKPIPILPAASNSINSLSATSFKHENTTQANKMKSKKKHNFKNQDLMEPDEDELEEDFDFEGNLALFDKKEIFKEIDNENIFGIKNQKPDLVRQLHKQEEKYRHDENVLDSMLIQFKNVQLEFKPKQEYFTDEPFIVIPSIPQSLRNRIQNLASDHGYSLERQNDFLARGAVELALTLLGGQRRLSPKNLHQWPVVVIICDEPYNCRQSEIGLSCGRQLASHGLKVMVYVKTSSHSDKTSKELELFTASGNDFTGNVKDLIKSDLVILSCANMNQNSEIVRYVKNNRAPCMAIDPPATGLAEIPIRNAIIPILPLDDYFTGSCGSQRLYLVNVCIPEKFFKDCGIKYYPAIFGSKFIIPLHLVLNKNHH